MIDASELTAMIEETGGLPVILGAQSTHGHRGEIGRTVFGEGGGSSTDGGTPPGSQVVVIASGTLAGLEVGSSITVGGEAAVVRGLVPRDFGLQTQILLQRRTHVFSIYRPSELGMEDAWGAPRSHWDLIASGVEGNFEPESGEVLQTGAGRLTTARWKGFIDPGADVRTDDGILVTSGAGPVRYQVTRVAAHGSHWDTELDLVRTERRFT